MQKSSGMRIYMSDFYLGLDVGGTNLAAGVVNAEGNLLEKAVIPSGAGRSIEAIAEDMYQVSVKALKSNGLSFADVPYWGIGIPSNVDKETGLLIHANCFGWHKLPIYQYLKKYIDKPIYIENDANCAVLGEARSGAGKGVDQLLMLTLGTGVGSGIILDGELYTGHRGLGAELGHTKLNYQGRRCTCGQRGCLEAYASATALIGKTGRALRQFPDSVLNEWCAREKGLTGKMIFEAAKEQDAFANRMVTEYVQALAAGIASFITIFRPEMIVLGGGIAGAGDYLVQMVEQSVREQSYGATEIGIPRIVCAKLGNDAGMIGAALLKNETGGIDQYENNRPKEESTLRQSTGRTDRVLPGAKG